MKIVFFGTSEFAIPSLRKLIESKHEVLAVVAQADKKKGRALKLSPPATKVLALAHKIEVYQPIDASDPESIEYLNRLGADIFVVVSFGQILKEKILEIPKFGAVNVHGSLLPKYRGAAPTNWAIINGDKKSGITIMKVNAKMDAGDILLKKEVAVGQEDTNITLSETLADLGASALLEALELIGSGGAVFTAQDGSQVSYAPKLRKGDGRIDWNEPAVRIHNKVRGLIPWPSAYTGLDGKTLKILRTEIPDMLCAAPPQAENGEVVDVVKGRGIIVKTGSGNIAITHLQIEGKKVLDADSFLRGHRICLGQRFTS